nr:tyrosine--tRNA ligase [Desulfuromonadales bacterium]
SWYRLLFQKGDSEIAALQQGHPMDIKKDLAETIVAQYHDAAAARQAREDFEAQFSKKDYSEVATTLSVPAGEIWIVELVEKTGKFTSRGEIRRLVQGGGVSLDGEKISDPQARVTPAS